MTESLFVGAVLTLLGLVGAKRLQTSATGARGKSEKALEILETVSLSHKERLILVRVDKSRHLFLIGTGQALEVAVYAGEGGV